ALSARQSTTSDEHTEQSVARPQLTSVQRFCCLRQSNLPGAASGAQSISWGYRQKLWQSDSSSELNARKMGSVYPAFLFSSGLSMPSAVFEWRCRSASAA